MVHKYWTGHAVHTNKLTGMQALIKEDIQFPTKKEAREWMRAVLKPPRGYKRIFTYHEVETHACADCTANHLVGHTWRATK